MSLNQLIYEWRLHWKAMFLAPVALMIACVLFALLQLNLKENIGRTYLSFAEVFLPLAAGVISGSLIVHDPALELQLTMAQTYRKTTFQRILLLMLIYACMCCLLISSMALLHFWFLSPYMLTWPLIWQWTLAQLIWFAPLVWFVAVGMCISIITLNNVANGAILTAFWIIELLYWGPFHANVWLRSIYIFPTIIWIYQGENVALPAWYLNAFWLVPHLEQIAMAVIVFVLSWFLLRNTEHLLKGATAE
jgi:hypothetical protein